MPRGTLGLMIGVILGFALIVGNFGDMLIVALFGAIGYGVQQALDGDLDVSRFFGGRRDR